MAETKLVPPDGGYGWIIVGACAFYYFITVSIAQGFRLVFKDTFKDLQFSATNISLIMNTNAAFSMFVGIIVAPLLKQFGYRKVSLIAGGLISTGVLITAYANSFTQYLIAYGFITALGTGMGMPAYLLALSSYFINNRTRAMGYALTICGIGAVIMPHIFSFLLELYRMKGTVVIIASIATNTFVSGLLLQPLKWHMKEEIIGNLKEAENDNLLEKEKDNGDDFKESYKSSTKSALPLEEAVQIDATYNIDTPFSGSALPLPYGFQERLLPISSRKEHNIPQNIIQEDIEMNEFKVSSQNVENLKVNSTNIHDINSLNDDSPDKVVNVIEETNKSEDRSLLKRIGKHIVNIFDLTLLKDHTFLNIMIGMSFAVFAELNFSILTPFIIGDFGLATQQIATFMSVVSIVDILFRFIAPYVSDFFAQPVRIMYLWALVLSILSRFSLLLTSNYLSLLVCAAFLGIAKGFRIVYWSLVIPDNVPIERLAAASGLQSTFNSLLIFSGAPFLGFVRDVTGSYKNCIFVINYLTFLTIALWSIEFAYKEDKSRRKFERKN